MTPKNDFEHHVKLDVEDRVRRGAKAVLEEVLEEEMTQTSKPATGSSPPPGEESAIMDITSATS